MRSLAESLFDQDLAKKDIKIDDLYKFAEIPHYNIIGGNLDAVINMFKRNVLKKFIEPKRREVDNHAYIHYIDSVYKLGWGVNSIINILLNMPASILPTDDYIKLMEDNAEERLYKYLEQYIDPKRLYKFFVELKPPTRGKGTICVNLIYDKNGGNPCNVCITLKKKL